jgi:hypothetical protein
MYTAGEAARETIMMIRDEEGEDVVAGRSDLIRTCTCYFLFPTQLDRSATANSFS